MSERMEHEQRMRGDGQAGRPMSPRELERELEDTRHEMNATLEEIAHRLSPNAIFNWATSYVQKGPPREFADNLAKDVRRNPLPVALTGIGIAWLMMGSRQRKPKESYRSTSAKTEETREKAEAKAESARKRMEQTSQRLGESAERTRQRMQEMAASGRLWAVRASRTGSDLRDRSQQMMHEQPLVMGALGVAFGALIGAALPRMKGDSRMEKAREKLSEKASETAGEATVRSAEKAEEAVKKAGESATSSIEEAERRSEAGKPPPAAPPQS